MDKETNLKTLFPGLSSDPAFYVSSPEDPNYNCIAWAYQMYTDRWMQPQSESIDLDGVTWWPDGAMEGMSIQCLLDAFQKIGYACCPDVFHETGFQKVALYYDPATGNWTHAARESRTGEFWMSKLGQSFDIHHATPYTLEGEVYGKVYCIMKREENPLRRQGNRIKIGMGAGFLCEREEARESR